MTVYKVEMLVEAESDEDVDLMLEDMERDRDVAFGRVVRAKFQPGDRVLLPENPEEGMPREAGVVEVVQENGMYTVRVDGPEYDGDDRVRDVYEGQMVMDTAWWVDHYVVGGQCALCANTGRAAFGFCVCPNGQIVEKS